MNLAAPTYHRPKKQGGMALIMVMLIILVLGALAGKLAFDMKVETTLARRSLQEPDLEWIGRSGVEYAKMVLGLDAMDNTRPFDHEVECWAGGPGGNLVADINASAFADPAAIPQCLPMQNVPLGRGTFSLKIEDLDRKFNINVADPMILQGALNMIGVDAAMIPTIVDSIMDWRDPDDAKRPSGADGDDYLDNPNPPHSGYATKNGPFDDISELLLIRGVTPPMYFGAEGGGPTQYANPLGRGRFDEAIYTVGLKNVFTSLSGRQLNVNTADRDALQVLPQIDAHCADMIIMERNGYDGVPQTEDDTPFRSVQELQRVVCFGNNPLIMQQLSSVLNVRSLVFEVTVTASIGGHSRTYTAILRRNNPRDIQVLTFY